MAHAEPGGLLVTGPDDVFGAAHVVGGFDDVQRHFRVHDDADARMPRRTAAIC